MPIDVARQDRCFAFRWDGVTAALEERERGGERGCLLWTLTNIRPTPATVVVRLEGGRGVRLVLLPFQKLGVYPPLAVASVKVTCHDPLSDLIDKGQRDAAARQIVPMNG